MRNMLLEFYETGMGRAGWGRERREYSLGRAGQSPLGTPECCREEVGVEGRQEEEKGTPAMCQAVFCFLIHLHGEARR